MPVLSKFYGIVIRMVFAPSFAAHFHASYGTVRTDRGRLSVAWWSGVDRLLDSGPARRARRPDGSAQV